MVAGLGPHVAGSATWGCATTEGALPRVCYTMYYTMYYGQALHNIVVNGGYGAREPGVAVLSLPGTAFPPSGELQACAAKVSMPVISDSVSHMPYKAYADMEDIAHYRYGQRHYALPRADAMVNGA